MFLRRMMSISLVLCMALAALVSCKPICAEEQVTPEAGGLLFVTDAKGVEDIRLAIENQ